MKTVAGKGSTALSDFGAIQLVDGKYTNARQPIARGIPVIIDHFAVDQYGDIPPDIMALIKTRWVSYAGESHSGAVRAGVLLLEAEDSDFAVSVTESGTPEGPTTAHLRVSRATWGNRTTPASWIYSYGEEDFYTSAEGRAQTIAGLDYCQANIPLRALIFGWCWDMVWHNPLTATKDPVYKCGWAGASESGPEGDLAFGLDAEDAAITGNSVCMDTYLSAVMEYNQHCQAEGHITNVCFSTGPVDDTAYDDEIGWQREVKTNYIRAFVSGKSVYLFDYSDIVSWDNAGAENIKLWTDADGGFHPYQWVADDNLLNLDGSDGYATSGYHLGERGAKRLAKAIWVLMARMEGWTPTITGSPTISGLSSSTAGPGDTVVITGTNFTGAGSVKVGARPCSFVVDSSTQITITIPLKCESGAVTVYNAAAKATGPTLNIVIPPWNTITVDTDGVSGDYATLDAALEALPNPLTNNVHIECYASTGTADSTAISRVLYTTAEYRVTVIGHSGYKYAPAGASKLTLTYALDSFHNITFQNVVFEKPSMAADYNGLVMINTLRDGTVIFDRCYFLGAVSAYRDRLVELHNTVGYNAMTIFSNCRFISRSTSTNSVSAAIFHYTNLPAYFYNCLIVGRKAWYTAADLAIYKNCLIKTIVAGEAVSTSCDYNSFSGAFSTGGAHDRQEQTFSFADEGGLDFHLAAGDTGAKDWGVDLSGDSIFPVTIDADGNPRTGTWDIGPYVA